MKRDTIGAALEKMLKGEGIELVRAEDPPAIGFSVRGENGTWPCVVRVDEEEGFVVFYSLCPLPVTDARGPAVVELLTRLNFGLPVATFEIDMDDWEVRVRTSIDFAGTKPSIPLMQESLVANTATLDAFLPAISAVLAGASVKEVAASS